MKVLLTSDVKKLGQKGQILDVSDGFARNFLLPRNLAAVATEGALNRVNWEIVSQENRRTAARESSARILAQIRSQMVKFALPADADGHLYAGLKESEILAKVSGGDKTLAKILNLESYTPLKRIGEHEISISAPGSPPQKITIFITRKS